MSFITNSALLLFGSSDIIALNLIYTTKYEGVKPDYIGAECSKNRMLMTEYYNALHSLPGS